MNDETLVDGVAKLVVEDLKTIDSEANWWHKRVRLLEHWLQDETSRVCMPDDGTEELIRRQIQRGDSNPRAISKCWKHIVLELRDLPCFAGVVAEARKQRAASPSRGKLRPGKDLTVPSDTKTKIEVDSDASTQGDEESNNASSSWSLEPLNPDAVQPSKSIKARPQSSAGYLSRRELVGTDTTSVGSVGTSFAGLSLLDRQMEWLRKKQDKVEAERLRQVEEYERELTFRPKLIRRITFSNDKSYKELQGPSSNKSLPRSESNRKVTDSGGAALLLKEKALPKVPRLSHHRRQRKKTLLQSATISQPVGVECKLLDKMKSELEASMASSRTNNSTEHGNDESQQQESDSAHTDEDDGASIENNESAVEGSEQYRAEPKTADEETLSPEKENAPAWSARPIIGGRRTDLSETKVRLPLQDASKFELSTMYRKTDRRAGREGVALHVGRREDTLEEQVIAVLFDKEKVTEEDAERWWTQHQHRFDIEPQESSEDKSLPPLVPMPRGIV